MKKKAGTIQTEARQGPRFKVSVFYERKFKQNFAMNVEGMLKEISKTIKGF